MGTDTSEGYIQNLPVDIPSMGRVFAPVKLTVESHIDPRGTLRRGILMDSTGKRPVPMRRDGRLVFALPGGGEALG